MDKAELIKQLKRVLANSYILYLKTHNYHWNVTGANFHSLHQMFEEQYQDLAEAVDEIAERIRVYGEYAPGSFKEFEEFRLIEDGEGSKEAKSMVSELRDDQKLICKVLYKAVEAASEIGDEASLDLAVGRIKVHEKNLWMLDSHLN